jgi:hypothetical protein
MSRFVLADTGPLVALFHEDDASHDWALARFQEFREPLLTCEAVLTEAMHLLRKVPPGHASLLSLSGSEICFGSDFPRKMKRGLSGDYCVALPMYRSHLQTPASSGCLKFTRIAWSGRWTATSVSTGGAGDSRFR